MRLKHLFFPLAGAVNPTKQMSLEIGKSRHTILGDSAKAEHVVVGPGDDGCVVRGHARRHIVSSIDALVPDVHFPAKGDSALIGYRSIMVSCLPRMSDFCRSPAVTRSKMLR